MHWVFGELIPWDRISSKWWEVAKRSGWNWKFILGSSVCWSPITRGKSQKSPGAPARGNFHQVTFLRLLGRPSWVSRHFIGIFPGRTIYFQAKKISFPWPCDQQTFFRPRFAMISSVNHRVQQVASASTGEDRLEHDGLIFPSWEFHHPNWLSYFSEGLAYHQPAP